MLDANNISARGYMFHISWFYCRGAVWIEQTSVKRYII